jgi:prophage regulatory protein
MQSKNSTECHGDLLESQNPRADPSSTLPGKSPECSEQSSTRSPAPTESDEFTGDLSDSKSSQRDTGTSRANQLGSTASSDPSTRHERQLGAPEEKAAANTPYREPKHSQKPRHKSPGDRLEVIPSSERFIRRREVQRLTGLSRSSLYRLIAEKDFPPAIQLSSNTVAWLESEINAWILDRVAASRKHPVSGKSSTGAR